MILSTLVTSQLHFEMCAGLYGHPVQLCTCSLRSQKQTLCIFPQACIYNKPHSV